MPAILAFILRVCAFPTVRSFAFGLQTGAELDSNDVWTIIAAYFAKHGLVRQQLKSFKRFMKYTIPSVLSKAPPIIVDDQAEIRVGLSRRGVSVFGAFLRSLTRRGPWVRRGGLPSSSVP